MPDRPETNRTRNTDLPAVGSAKAECRALFPRDGILRLSDDPVRFRLLAAGDLCPIHGIETALAAGRIESIFGDTLPLFRRADVAVVNLEAPLCDANAPVPKCGPNFRAAPAVASALREAGVSVCALSNNHIMDQGLAGLRETTAALDRAGIRHMGAGLSPAEAATPLLLNVAGKRLAMVNVAEGEFSRASDAAGVAGLDPVQNVRVVREAADSADWVVVILHAGCEEVLFPSPLNRKRCREFIDAGASALIAHHPHVPQGIELYRDRPIAYSLGNFFFDWSGAEPDTWTSFLLELGFADSGPAEIVIHPFARTGEPGVNLLAGDRKKAFLTFLGELSDPLGDPIRMSAIWQEQCRMLHEIRYRNRLKRFADLDADNPTLRQKTRLNVYNLFQCEAHREACEEILRQLAADDLQPDPSLRRHLESLMSRLIAFSAT